MTEAETFTQRVEALLAAAPNEGIDDGLSALDAAVLAALQLGLARDSLHFSKGMEVPHALVLRSCAVLAGEFGLITVHHDAPRDPRMRYSFSERGARLARLALCEHLEGDMT